MFKVIGFVLMTVGFLLALAYAFFGDKIKRFRNRNRGMKVAMIFGMVLLALATVAPVLHADTTVYDGTFIDGANAPAGIAMYFFP